MKEEKANDEPLRSKDRLEPSSLTTEERRHRFAMIVDAAHDAVLGLDLQGRIVAWNRGAHDLLGYAEVDIIGQSIARLIAVERREAEQKIHERVGRGEAVEQVESEWISRDGGRVPVYVSVSPIVNGDGRINGIALIARDYRPQLKRAEQTMLSESRKAAILHSALDCIITIDHEGRVLDFNPAAERTFGYRQEEVRNQLLGELIVPPSLREAHYRGMTHYLATGKGPVLDQRIEVTAMRSDGLRDETRTPMS